MSSADMTGKRKGGKEGQPAAPGGHVSRGQHHDNGQHNGGDHTSARGTSTSAAPARRRRRTKVAERRVSSSEVRPGTPPPTTEAEQASEQGRTASYTSAQAVPASVASPDLPATYGPSAGGSTAPTFRKHGRRRQYKAPLGVDVEAGQSGSGHGGGTSEDCSSQYESSFVTYGSGTEESTTANSEQLSALQSFQEMLHQRGRRGGRGRLLRHSKSYTTTVQPPAEDSEEMSTERPSNSLQDEELGIREEDNASSQAATDDRTFEQVVDEVNRMYEEDVCVRASVNTSEAATDTLPLTSAEPGSAAETDHRTFEELVIDVNSKYRRPRIQGPARMVGMQGAPAQARVVRRSTTRHPQGPQPQPASPHERLGPNEEDMRNAGELPEVIGMPQQLDVQAERVQEVDEHGLQHLNPTAAAALRDDPEAPEDGHGVHANNTTYHPYQAHVAPPMEGRWGTLQLREFFPIKWPQEWTEMDYVIVITMIPAMNMPALVWWLVGVFLHSDRVKKGLFGREIGPLQGHVHAQGAIKAPGFVDKRGSMQRVAKLIADTFNNALASMGYQHGFPIDKTDISKGVAKVMVHCKKIKNVGMHNLVTLCGGYNRKDWHHPHFRDHRKGLSEEELKTGWNDYLMYAASSLKQCVLLTPNNIIEKVFIYWQLEMASNVEVGFMSVLRTALRSGKYRLASEWTKSACAGLNYKKTMALFEMMKDASGVDDLDLIMLVFDEKTVSNDALGGQEDDLDENADIGGQLFGV